MDDLQKLLSTVLNTALEEKVRGLEKAMKELKDQQETFLQQKKSFDQEQEKLRNNNNNNNNNNNKSASDSSSSGSSSGKIKLDVGGVNYSTSITTLTSQPNSMLEAMFSGRYPIKKDEDGTVFIDRNGILFGVILDWLRYIYQSRNNIFLVDRFSIIYFLFIDSDSSHYLSQTYIPE